MVLLLFLKHFHYSGENILELTCTEKLQKWHRRINKGSIPMIPLKDIKVKSSKRQGGKTGFKIEAADHEKSSIKRKVTALINDLNKKLDIEKPVTEHVYSILSKSALGRNSSVGQHLCYKFKLNQIGDHQYTS